MDLPGFSWPVPKARVTSPGGVNVVWMSVVLTGCLIGDRVYTYRRRRIRKHISSSSLSPPYTHKQKWSCNPRAHSVILSVLILHSGNLTALIWNEISEVFNSKYLSTRHLLKGRMSLSFVLLSNIEYQNKCHESNNEPTSVCQQPTGHAPCWSIYAWCTTSWVFNCDRTSVMINNLKWCMLSVIWFYYND